MILNSQSDELNYLPSGLIGGLVTQFFIDFLGPAGVVLLVISGWLMLFRGYFTWNLYTPIAMINGKWKAWRTERSLVIKYKEKENVKRRHTQELISKIDEKKKMDENDVEPKSKEDQETNNGKKEGDHKLDLLSEDEDRSVMVEAEDLVEKNIEENKSVADRDGETIVAETNQDETDNNDIHVVKWPPLRKY